MHNCIPRHRPRAVLPPAQMSERSALRMGVPSKGRMAEDTQQLLKDCQLKVVKPNPRQYAGTISAVSVGHGHGHTRARTRPCRTRGGGWGAEGA